MYRLLVRKRYRTEFGLTAAEMDAEPLNEVLAMEAIWRIENKVQKKHERRSTQ